MVSDPGSSHPRIVDTFLPQEVELYRYRVLAIYLLLVLAFERNRSGREFLNNLIYFATYTSNWFVDLYGGSSSSPGLSHSQGEGEAGHSGYSVPGNEAVRLDAPAPWARARCGRHAAIVACVVRSSPPVARSMIDVI